MPVSKNSVPLPLQYYWKMGQNGKSAFVGVYLVEIE
jgi:hypothetical protein